MEKPNCSEDECPRPAKSRGLCTKHYAWHLRYGTKDQFPLAPPDGHRLVLKKSDGSFAVCHSCGPMVPRARNVAGVVILHCRSRQRKSPEISKAEHYWLKYKIRLADFDAMATQQDHRCAICRRARFLVVDHCHDTGVIRGLLCRQCNTGIGQLGDTSSDLERGLEYLRRHESGRLPLMVNPAA